MDDGENAFGSVFGRDAKLRKQFGVAGGLRRKAQPCGADDLGQLRQGYAKFLINNNIFAFRRVGDFAACRHEPARDHVRLILAARLQAAFELVDGRGQHENADRARKALLDLARALPVDFQEHVASLGGGLVDAVAGVP